ncbi:sugar dehydrogenase [Gordonia sp. CPCC 205515]|uniref:PQQ-dependent sugar dehydrogenase n=1 Tax=Gordonia sp. CPCC 205515 TaxID=3140791 RepID=UPI003AF3850C
MRTRRPWQIGPLVFAGVITLGASGCAEDSGSGGAGLSSAARPSASVGASTLPSGAAGSLAPTELGVAGGVDPALAQGRSLTVPADWRAEVWAEIPKARLAAWAPDGRLIVSTGNRGVLAALTPTSDGRAPTITSLVDDLSDPQGIAFARRGGRDVLVVGEDTRIVVWDYADGAVTNRQVLVDGLPSSGHGAKAVAVRDGVVYYSLGSSSNRDPGDRTANPQRAVVARVGLDGAGNAVFARGVRNGFGLATAPDGTLFVAVNHADNQPYPYRDDTDQYGQTVREYINENPVEQVTRLTDGTDLGWPYCVPHTRSSRDNRDLPSVPDPVNNPDGRELDCGALPNTMLGLPAHSAPLGLAFTTDTPVQSALGSGALITAHGSWNRQPPRPPYVAFSRWGPTTATLGPATELVTGFQRDDGTRWGRAVTAIPGPDGSIYVTDDAAGLVYRITPPN